MSHFRRTRISVRLKLPELVRRHEKWVGTLQISNGSASAESVRWKLDDVPENWMCSETSGIIKVVDHSAFCGIKLEFTASVRGVFETPSMSISDESYLGLFRRSEFVKNDCHIHVAPATAEAMLNEGHNVVGDVLCSVHRAVAAISTDDEYIGSREYVPGMNVRRWDQASSARLNALIVREYRQDSAGNVTLVVDDTVDAITKLHGTSDTELEVVLTLCATLIDHFATQQIRVSRIVTSDGSESRPERTEENCDWALRRLASVTSKRLSIANCPGVEALLTGETVVLVTYAWRNECDAFARKAAWKGLNVIPVCVCGSGVESQANSTNFSGAKA